MRIWSRFQQIFFPSLKTRIERELEEAKHELLSAQNHLDFYTAAVAYQRARIARLSKGDPT